MNMATCNFKETKSYAMIYDHLCHIP